MDKFVKVLILLALVSVAWCDTVKPCSDSLECAEEVLINAIDQLDAQKTMYFLNETVVIEKTKEIQAGKRKESVIDRMMRYLSSRDVKLNIPYTEASETESRRLKWKRYILPLLLFLILKATVAVPSVVITVSVLAVSAIAASFLALGFTGASGLKTIEYHAVPKISYQVVPQIWNRAAIDNFPFDQEYHTIP